MPKLQSKFILSLLIIVMLHLVLSACSDSNVISAEQIAIQNKADAYISGLLFDRELDTQASYNIRNNGFVVIEFSKNVAEKVYTEIVTTMRSSKLITGVRAEQAGTEICQLP